MPFSRTTAAADTCVLSDFIAAGRAPLLFSLFPDGIRADAGVVIELQDRFGSSLRDELAQQACELLIERGYGPAHYEEMAAIKRARPGLRHPDIATVVLARKHGGICLSSDGAVRKTCAERGVVVSGQLGCLRACIERGQVTHSEACSLLRAFLEQGLYLPQYAIETFMAGR